MDPCDLRLRKGPAAVAHLVDDAVPMFEFACSYSRLSRFDLTTAEGRVQAMRAVAPVINGIRDPGLRPEYLRTVAGWIGVEVDQLAAETRRAARAPEASRREQPAERNTEPDSVEPTAAGNPPPPCHGPTCAIRSWRPSGSSSRCCCSIRASSPATTSPD